MNLMLDFLVGDDSISTVQQSLEKVSQKPPYWDIAYEVILDGLIQATDVSKKPSHNQYFKTSQ